MTAIKPKFLIIGAQKAGTTALFNYLSKHPKIIPANVKEIDFFSCEGRFKQGIDFYHSHFRQVEAEKDLITFEASGDYLVCPLAARRIHEYYPQIKLIAILRDPIPRAFSAWNMYKSFFQRDRNWFVDWMNRCDNQFKADSIVRRSIEKFDNFEYAVREELDAVEKGKTIEATLLRHGKYSEQLKKYLEYFDRNQLMVIETNELKKETIDTLNLITDFLELDSHDWKNENLSRVFVGEYERSIPEKTIKFLSKYYEAYNNELYLLVGKKYPWL